MNNICLFKMLKKLLLEGPENYPTNGWIFTTIVN